MQWSSLARSDFNPLPRKEGDAKTVEYNSF